ncbi:GTPase, partial [Mycoplasmopsis synoviae]
FFRLNGRKISIVDDTPGVTRDRLYEVISWLNKQIKIIDTGGIEIKNAPFQEQIHIQANIAIEEADVIFFVFDGHSEISNDVLFIMNILKKANK